MLFIEVADGEILVHYLAPDAGPNNGGYLGRVFPGGNFHGLSYRKLLALGSGSHEVEVNERASSNRGNEPTCSAEDEMLGELRWSMFMYQVGACIADEVIHSALLAMTPNNIARAVALLPIDWLRRMREFAAQVPVYRERGGCRFYSSGQQVELIPDENMVVVHQWFTKCQPKCSG